MTCTHEKTSQVYAHPLDGEPLLGADGRPVLICLDCLAMSNDDPPPNHPPIPEDRS